MSDLEQIVDGVEPAPEAEAVTPETSEAPAEPQAAPEPETPPEPQAQEPEMVPHHVVGKLRQELRGLKAQLAAAQQPQPQAPEFVDPEGAAHFQQQIAMMQANFAAEKSEMMARVNHGSDAVDAALQAAEAAGVVDQFRGQQDPWGALAKWHKSTLVQQEIGDDPAAYKAKVEAEIRAKVEAEMVAKQAQEKAAQSAPSMANVTGTGGGPKTAWAGPTSLDSLLGS